MKPKDIRLKENRSNDVPILKGLKTVFFPEVVIAMKDEHFQDILFTSCVHTTGKNVEPTSGQLVREWELSQQTNLTGLELSL